MKPGPHPCVLCADRRDQHFRLWAALTWSEVAMLCFAAVLLGFCAGWMLCLELQRQLGLVPRESLEWLGEPERAPPR